MIPRVAPEGVLFGEAVAAFPDHAPAAIRAVARSIRRISLIGKPPAAKADDREADD